MTKVLIVGQNGFVSQSFKRYMNKFIDMYELTFVSSRKNIWKKISFKGYDAVFNASGLAHANAKDGSDEDYFKINGKLPGEIAEKCKAEGVPLYISISSSIIYGDTSDLGKKKIIKKNTLPDPKGIYGKSKIMGENETIKYVGEQFQVAIIRPPMIYSEYAPENFELLCKFATRFPLIPDIYNEQSMIYADNFCELLRLIIDNQAGGIYYPQEKNFIQTSKLVKDIADSAGHKMAVTKIFNPILKLLAKRVRFIRKAFGSLVYDKEMSNHFEWNYCIVSYEETVERIAKRYKNMRNVI